MALQESLIAAEESLRAAEADHAAAIAFGNLPVLESDGSENSRPASANPRLLSRKGPRPAWDSYAAFNAKLALTLS